MSKMSMIHAELMEQCARLGFQDLGEAEQAGYGVDWQNARLIKVEDEQDKAHEAWLKEKHEVLHLLESVKEDIIDLNGGNNNHVAIDELDYVIDFLEKGEC